MNATALALAAALFVSQPTDTPPADAPVETVIGITKDTPAPFDGVLLSDEQAIRTARRVAAAEAERDELRKAPMVRPWAVVLVGVLALGAGVAVGYGVAAAVRR